MKRRLSSSTQEYVSDNSLAYKYFFLNMTGQYLDQLIRGLEVAELEPVKSEEYVTEDGMNELLFDVPESADQEPWDHVVEELRRYAAEKSHEFILELDRDRPVSYQPSQLDRWIGARLVWQGYYYLDRNLERYEAELDWIENPFGVIDSITYRTGESVPIFPGRR